MKRKEYEVVLKDGLYLHPTMGGKLWDKVIVFRIRGLNEARIKRDELRSKHPAAHILIRDAVTLDLAG